LIRIARETLLGLMEEHAALRTAIWQAFAERLLFHYLRAAGRFGHLGVEERKTWARKGRHMDLCAGDTVSTADPSMAMVLSGSIQIGRDGVRLTVMAPNLVEMDAPTQIGAKAPSRLMLLPGTDPAPAMVPDPRAPGAPPAPGVAAADPPDPQEAR